MLALHIFEIIDFILMVFIWAWIFEKIVGYIIHRKHKKVYDRYSTDKCISKDKTLEIYERAINKITNYELIDYICNTAIDKISIRISWAASRGENEITVSMDFYLFNNIYSDNLYSSDELIQQMISSYITNLYSRFGTDISKLHMSTVIETLRDIVYIRLTAYFKKLNYKVEPYTSCRVKYDNNKSFKLSWR